MAEARTMVECGDRTASPSHRMALPLAAIAILWSALHLWPFAGSKVWQLLYPVNLASLLWAGVVVAYALSRRERAALASSLPHVSVLAYLATSLLSMAFAREATRTVGFETKLLVMYIAGYALFRAALRDHRSVRLLLGAALIAHLFSSVQCHGVLVAFVFVLSLVSAMDTRLGGPSRAAI